MDDLNKDIEKRLKKLFEDVADTNKKYGGFFNIPTITKNTTEAKKVINEFDEWLQKRLEDKDPVDELEDEYIRLLALAIKYNRGIEEVEAWHQEELKKIRDKARDDEEAKRKADADKAWNDLQTELKRMREARYDIKDPSLEIPKTQYTQGFAKIFGLSGEFSYSSKKDIEGYKDRLLGTDTEEGSIDKYNNQIKTRLEEQKSFLLKQLENETLTADQRKLIKLELDSIDEQLTENEIDRENKKNKVRENVNKQYQESIKACLDLASKVAGSMATI